MNFFFFDKRQVYSYNKTEHPKGEGQEGPPRKKLKS